MQKKSDFDLAQIRSRLFSADDKNIELLVAAQQLDYVNQDAEVPVKKCLGFKRPQEEVNIKPSLPFIGLAAKHEQVQNQTPSLPFIELAAKHEHAQNQPNIDRIQTRLNIMFCGESGVGKSSLIQSLIFSLSKKAYEKYIERSSDKIGA